MAPYSSQQVGLLGVPLFWRQESCGKDTQSIKADGLLNTTVPVLSTEVNLVTEDTITHASPK